MDETDETIPISAVSTEHSDDFDDVTVTIKDNDAPPSISFSSSTATADEGESAVSLTASLSAESGKTVTVDYATANGTAMAGTDYTAKSSTLTFSPGDTSKTISVSITDDTAVEPDETFTVRLSSPSNATLGSPPSSTVTIRDNDDPPKVSLSYAAADYKATEGGSSATVSVNLSAEPKRQVTIPIVVTRKAGASSADYSGIPSSVTFGSNDKIKTFEVTATDDTVDDDGEWLALSFGKLPAGVTAGSVPTERVDLIDNDAPSVSLSSSSATVGERAANVSLTAILSTASDRTVTVDYATSDGSAKSGSDYVTASGTLKFAAGVTKMTLSVSLKDDSIDEPGEIFTVSLSNPSNVTLGSASKTTVTIEDNDEAPTPSLSLSSSTIEEGDSATVKAHLSHPSSEPTTVTVSASGVTVAGGKLTIPAGEKESTGSATLKSTDDNVRTGDRTVTVSGAARNSQGLKAQPADVTLTIKDNDRASTRVTLSVSPRSIDEDGGEKTMRVTGELNHSARTAATAVTVSIAGTSRTLTIPAGDVSGSVELSYTPKNNDEDEPDWTVDVTGSTSVSGLSVSGTSFTVRDDDPPPKVLLSSADVRVAEDAGLVRLKVGLDEASGYSVTVKYATVDGSAKAGSDYTSASGTLTFSPGQTEKALSITLKDDSTVEPNETFEVRLSSPSRATLGSPSKTAVTITDDDDDVPEVSLSSASLSVLEDAGPVDLTVRLNTASSTAVTVDYVTSDGSAKSGSDYVSASGTLTFAAGETKKTVSVTLKDDSIDEPNEDFTVSLGRPSGATLGSIKSTVVTITDDDPPPELSLSSSSVQVAEDAGSVRLKVRLDEASGYTVTVEYATADGSAKAGSDYTSATGTLTFSPGQTEKAIDVSVTDDTATEPNETFEVRLSSPSKATLGSPSKTAVTITDDDDEAPEVSLSLASVSASVPALEDAGPVGLTVRLDTAATSAVTVGYATADGSAKSGSDYVTASGTLKFAAGETKKTVSVTLKDDSIDEPGETFTVSLSNPSGATLGRPSAATVTIRDNDDAPGVSLVLTPSSISEAGGVSGVTAHLTHPSAEDTVVTVSASPVAPAVAGDIEQSGVRLTVAAGERDSTGSVTVRALDNAVHAPDKRVTVSGSASNALGIAGDPEDVTLTLEEDDPPPSVTVSFAQAGYTVREGGAAGWVRVTLSGPLASSVAIPLVATPGGGATAPGKTGADYSDVPERLTFDAGSTSQTFSVTATDDAIDDDGEQVSLRFGALPGGLRFGDTSEAVVVIEDNDRRGLALAPEQLRLQEGTSATYTVSLTSEPTAEVTVVVTGASGTDLEVSPERLLFTASDWSQVQDITVKAGHDKDAFDDAIRFTHTAAGGDYGVLDPEAFTVTVFDGDPRWVAALSVSPATVSEGAGAASASLEVTATLNEARGEDTQVHLHARPGPDTEAGDFAFAPAPLVIPANATAATTSVTLTPADDRIVEGAETVALVGASEGVAVTEAAITITDDDAPSWTLGLSPSSVIEAGGVSTLTVDTGGVTFEDSRTLALTFGGTADIGADYSVTSGGSPLAGPPYALVLPSGASSIEARITARPDSMSDPDETVEITVRHDKTEIGTATLTITEGICARTPAVRDALTSAAGAASCTDVDADDLSAIASLDFSGGTVTSLTLNSGDLAGLSGLETLIFRGVALTSLPTDLFAGLSALELLNLKSTGLTALPDGVFKGLSRLDRLTLENNALGRLSSNTFAGLTSLTDLNLRKTSLTALPDGLFEGLAKLTGLNLRGNRITQLSSGIFRPLAALETLNLISNRLSALPDGLFEGLGSLKSVRLDGNSGSPFALALTLEKVGEDGVRMALPAGAPFDIVVAASVSANGTLQGLDHGLTIATGKVHSNSLKVSRKAGEPGAVTATLAELPVLPSTHQGYAVAKSADLPLTVLSGYVSAALSVADPPDVKESEGARVAFTVTLAPAVDREVTVTYATADGTAKAGVDYEAVSGTLTFKAGETSKTVTVKVLDDAVDETRETFRLTLLKALGADIADGDGEVAIVNADPLPKAWLARFGGVVAGHVADGIGERLAQPERTPPQATLAGVHLTSGEEAWSGKETSYYRGSPNAGRRPWNPKAGEGGASHGAVSPGGPHDATIGTTRGLTARDMLLGSAFTVALGGDEEGAAVHFTLWGRSMATRFEGAEDELRLDGEVATYLLGADRSWGRWRAGMALAQSRGAGGYDASASEQGELESNLLSVHPYARYAASERLTAWGLLGYGQGNLTLNRQGSGTWNTDTSMTMAALGARGTLFPAAYAGGFELAVRTDALWTSIASGAAKNPDGRMAAADGDASRLRLILEGARTWAAADGRRLTPNVELGLRHDTGDAETGTGIELGAGVRFDDPTMGLSIEVKARSFIAHQNEAYREWGASAAIRLDPATPGRGLMLILTPAWGQAAGGAERLWSQHGLKDMTGYGAAAPAGRLDAEVSYALDGPRGRGAQAPYAAWLIENARSQALRVGWRWRIGEKRYLDIEGTRRQAPNGQNAEHGISLRTSVRW